MLVTIPNQDIPFNEVGSAVHITGINGIILRLQESDEEGGKEGGKDGGGNRERNF